jgi:hypothetical protein
MINKGLTSLVNASPDFSNQGLENAINELKIGWVIKSFTLDTAITNNTVLTTSQKNDAKDTINNIAHLNVGRYLGDLLRHTSTILDGTIVHRANPDTEDTATFLEILQTVQAIQNLIPDLYGVTPAEKNRDVNDHLGSLNNKFLETEDSSAPVFTSLKESITFINNASQATETALETAYDNLTNFVDSVVADSTDFQQTLNTFASAVATAHTNFNNALASEPYLTKRTQLTTDRDSIVTQTNLEGSNLSGIRTYTESLTHNISYTSLAENNDLRQLMSRVSQNADWQTYFNDYVKNYAYLNPMYNTDTDSDKSAVIDRILREKGLPDVLDFVNIEGVANKAKEDLRIDTKNFDYYTTEQIIKKCCEQLSITTSNKTVYNQSELLLNNLNQRDRDIIAEALDFNENSDTLS